jgi:hypothetical protein
MLFGLQAAAAAVAAVATAKVLTTKNKNSLDAAASIDGGMLARPPARQHLPSASCFPLSSSSAPLYRMNC